MTHPFRNTALLAMVLLVAGRPVSSGFAATKQRPNIVFILADDLGYGDLGCYGQMKIDTPRLDEIARQGIRFTQHYAGHNVCAPTRCVLMTGKHTGHAHVRGNQQARDAEGQLPLPADAVTIASVLRRAGYATGMFGKWGLGNPGTTGDPLRHGWDTYFGYTDQIRAHNYFPDFLLKDGRRIPLDNEVQYLSPQAWHKGIGSYSTKQNVYSHDLIERAALDFIRKHKDGPFFAYLPFTLPDDNGEAPRLQMEVPDFGRYAKHKDWTLNSRGYAAMVTRLDRSVGRVIDLLDELGISENTLVVFTSDNGPVAVREDRPDRTVTAFFRSNGEFRGTKGTFYEGGTGPVEVRAVQPNSVADLWPHWKSKTPAPVGRSATSPPDRRFWPVTMTYADGIELHFTPWDSTQAGSLKNGPDFIVFHGEKGRLKMRRNHFETDPPGLISSGPDATAVDKWKGGGHVARPHLENWLDAIRNGAPLNAPIEVGHRTVTICHLANIARELNRPLRWDPVLEQFSEDAAADESLTRPRRNGFSLP